MALRVALGRAKPWRLGFQLPVKGNLGFLGAIGSGMTGGTIVEQNRLRRFRSLNQSCRHYFLPPPPPKQVVDCLQFQGVFPISQGSVLPFAEFAVKTHNEDQGGGDIVRFVRVVRASMRSVGTRIFYYITLEAVDEKGDLNVYYAVVEERHFENVNQLVRWQLVHDSFSYPFQEISYNKQFVREIEKQEAACRLRKLLLRKIQREDEDKACKNKIKSVFHPSIGSPYLPIQAIDFENSLLNADPLLTAASDVVVPVHDIEAYEKVYEYASFAVRTHNKNEDDVIHLEEVLSASKFKTDGGLYYGLLLEALDRDEDLNFFVVVLKVGQSQDELIRFLRIDESLCNTVKEHRVHDWHLDESYAAKSLWLMAFP